MSIIVDVFKFTISRYLVETYILGARVSKSVPMRVRADKPIRSLDVTRVVDAKGRKDEREKMERERGWNSWQQL